MTAHIPDVELNAKCKHNDVRKMKGRRRCRSQDDRWIPRQAAAANSDVVAGGGDRSSSSSSRLTSSRGKIRVLRQLLPRDPSLSRRCRIPVCCQQRWCTGGRDPLLISRLLVSLPPSPSNLPASRRHQRLKRRRPSRQSPLLLQSLRQPLVPLHQDGRRCVCPLFRVCLPRCRPHGAAVACLYTGARGHGCCCRWLSYW